ncbi:MAG TPA: hemerythrin domain-containing protein [Candidatus Sulfotelmatobacter sp.]
MLRDKNLIPLSRQHQHALALCVRIDRASPVGDADLAAWQAEIAQHFQSEIRVHFAAEEQVLFPAAWPFPDLVASIEDLLTDHAALRESFAKAEAGQMTATELSAFGQRMSTHIRKEERRLFERLQELVSAEGLALLGARLDEALKDAAHACALPADANKLRSAK